MTKPVNLLHIVLNGFVNDSRVQKECKTLLDNGYSVTVFALHEKALPLEESSGLFTLHRFRLTTRSWSKNKLVQLIKYLECLIRMVHSAMKVRPAIIHVHDLGALPIGVMIALFIKAPLVYDAHEFETEQQANPNRIFHFFMVLLERMLIKRADAVITVSEGIASEYARRYGIAKPRLVLNCPPLESVPKTDVLRRKFKIRDDQIVFLYQGGLFEGRGIENLIRSFCLYPGDEAVIVFMGYGPLETNISAAAKLSPKIFYHPAVSPRELLPVTASADIGISAIENTCLSHYYCLPNKIFEYAMAGLPLLVSDLVEMKRLVEEYDCGMVMESDTPEGILAAVVNIMRADRETYSTNARKVAQDYNWEKQEQVLLSMYRSLSCVE